MADPPVPRRPGRTRRALFLSTGLATGGAEMMLYKLVSTLPRAEFEVTVVSLRDRGTIGPRIEALGVAVHDLRLDRAWRLPIALVQLAVLCRRLRPDLLVGWMYHGNLLASLARGIAARRASVIWSVRQTLYDLRLERWLTALTIRAGALWSAHPAVVVYNSQVAVNQHRAHGYRPRREVVIPNGFDGARFSPRPDARRPLRGGLGIGEGVAVVGMVARYHPMKDHLTFFQAASRLVAAGSQAHFVCAGPGVDPGNRALADSIASLGLAGRVHLLGETEDIASLLAGLDILCSASSSGEGFSNVIGEAMACGVPCVVTNIGDSALIVGPTGIVVPPADPGAMSAGCEALLGESAAEKARRSESARARILELFPLSAITQRYAELFHEIAEAADGGEEVIV